MARPPVATPLPTAFVPPTLLPPGRRQWVGGGRLRTPSRRPPAVAPPAVAGGGGGGSGGGGGPSALPPSPITALARGRLPDEEVFFNPKTPADDAPQPVKRRGRGPARRGRGGATGIGRGGSAAAAAAALKAKSARAAAAAENAAPASYFDAIDAEGLRLDGGGDAASLDDDGLLATVTGAVCIEDLFGNAPRLGEEEGSRLEMVRSSPGHVAAAAAAAPGVMPGPASRGQEERVADGGPLRGLPLDYTPPTATSAAGAAGVRMTTPPEKVWVEGTLDGDLSQLSQPSSSSQPPGASSTTAARRAQINPVYSPDVRDVLDEREALRAAAAAAVAAQGGADGGEEGDAAPPPPPPSAAAGGLRRGSTTSLAPADAPVRGSAVASAADAITGAPTNGVNGGGSDDGSGSDGSDDSGGGGGWGRFDANGIRLRTGGAVAPVTAGTSGLATGAATTSPLAARSGGWSMADAGASAAAAANADVTRAANEGRRRALVADVLSPADDGGVGATKTGANGAAPAAAGVATVGDLASAGMSPEGVAMEAQGQSFVDAMRTAVGSSHAAPDAAEVRAAAEAAASAPVTVLSIGALVSHPRNGIGRFRGLERSGDQEYAVVEYRDGDIYLPAAQLDSLTPVIETAEEVKAGGRHLDAIASVQAYNDLKARRGRARARALTRDKIRKQLVNLGALYTARQSLSRPPYAVHAEAEAAFAEDCSFALTPDQEVAIGEVLRDLSDRARPMERLVVGDVGFGKTEVALRATVRVLLNGFQVAVLAPTTILAQQHYETFVERLAALPVGGAMSGGVRVACLTRFTKHKVKRETLEALASGVVNVVVGTHLVLSDKVQFARLGLLVVDEEHRFGVNQKEKMRARFPSVDTAFLSATPIPRTLHLSLAGLRDASILSTPPPGRKPVITYVAPLGAGHVRSALSTELARGGQVFYVVPRISGLDATVAWVEDLIPGLRVLAAHGEMRDLEARIWSFAMGEADVLVCTTIIENGINMPRVNTIIVQDASYFGLAQLHQLRGRVGRSRQQAYAWMFHPVTESVSSAAGKDGVITRGRLAKARRPGGAQNDASERLQALAELSELGAGFAIAQRDMQLRGIGTVLGVEQHGHSAVGGDEYAAMLTEELERARRIGIQGTGRGVTLPGRMAAAASNPSGGANGESMPPGDSNVEDWVIDAATGELVPAPTAGVGAFGTAGEASDAPAPLSVLVLPPPATTTEVYLPVPSLIPSSYISDFELKMAAYSLLARCRSPLELTAATERLTRVYGPPPRSVNQYVRLVSLKLTARRLGISRVYTDRQHIALDWAIHPDALALLIAVLPEARDRARLEGCPSEERVLARGLSICEGDVQLGKLTTWFDAWVVAASRGFDERELIGVSKVAAKRRAAAAEAAERKVGGGPKGPIDVADWRP
ncbi:hypothetical protein MMPV_010132 [Pyropia vietnamensis]